MTGGLKAVLLAAFGLGSLIGALESTVLLFRSPDIDLVNPAADLVSVILHYGVAAMLLSIGIRILRPSWSPTSQALGGGILVLFAASFVWLHSRILNGESIFSLSGIIGTGALCLLISALSILLKKALNHSPKGSLCVGSLLLIATSAKIIDSGTTSIDKGPQPSAPNLPDVTVVLIDTLRADRLSTYGYLTPDGQPTSPVIDAIAKKGVRFDAAYASAPWTRPSVASLFSGLHPSAHGANTIYRALPPETETLAEQFHSQGYRTGGFSANSHISQVFGFNQGFEHFWCLTDKNLLTLLAWGELERRIQRVFKIVPFVEDHAGIVNEQVLAWAARKDHRPTFTYVHYVDPHYPYSPPEDLLHGDRWDLNALTKSILPQVDAIDPFPFAASKLTACEKCTGLGFQADKPQDSCKDCNLAETVQGVHSLYESEIRFVDRELGKLLQALEALEIASDEDFVLILSDHGEEFYEHKQWGHGHSMFEELMRVPLIATGPSIPPEFVVSTPVGLVDVFATLVNIANPTLPNKSHGRSLHPFWQNNTTVSSHDVFGEKFNARDLLMLRSGNKKFIQIPHSGEGAGETKFEMVFDIQADPMESKNLAPENPVALARLRARALALRNLALSMALDSKRMELDEETRQRLAEMGYADGFGEESP